MNNTLYVIAPITNFCRYDSRNRLYRNFEKYIERGNHGAHVELRTVECAYADRPYELTSPDKANNLQLNTRHELWLKENLINIAVSRLPRDWQYVAWIDADVEFERPDWARETLQQLKHYSLVQLFSEAIDLGPNHQVIQVHRGFGSGYLHRKEHVKFHCKWTKEYEYWHTGFAWAMRREAWDKLGGLIDWAALGAADHHMAWGLVGEIRNSVPKNISPRYLAELIQWEANAECHIRRNIGYVPGMLKHFWHGKKKDRKYIDRWKILSDNSYDPDLDLKRDWQGVQQLTNRSIVLRDQIRSYFRARNEDSIDLE